jgi:hypothetical protein
MFEARDFPDGLDRVGVVCLAIVVIIPFDLGMAPLHRGSACAEEAGGRTQAAAGSPDWPKSIDKK